MSYHEKNTYASRRTHARTHAHSRPPIDVRGSTFTATPVSDCSFPVCVPTVYPCKARLPQHTHTQLSEPSLLHTQTHRHTHTQLTEHSLLHTQTHTHTAESTLHQQNKTHTPHTHNPPQHSTPTNTNTHTPS